MTRGRRPQFGQASGWPRRDDTIERGRHGGATAVDALARFPASPWKQAGRDAAAFSVSRAR